MPPTHAQFRSNLFPHHTHTHPVTIAAVAATAAQVRPAATRPFARLTQNQHKYFDVFMTNENSASSSRQPHHLYGFLCVCVSALCWLVRNAALQLTSPSPVPRSGAVLPAGLDVHTRMHTVCHSLRPLPRMKLLLFYNYVWH